MRNNLQEYIEMKFLESHLDEYLKEQGCNPDDFKFGEIYHTENGLGIKPLSKSKEEDKMKMSEEKVTEKYGPEMGYLFKSLPNKKMYFIANYDAKISLAHEVKVLHGTYHICTDNLYETFDKVSDMLMDTLVDEFLKGNPFKVNSSEALEEFLKPGVVSYNIDMVRIDTVNQPGDFIKEYDGKDYSILYEVFHILTMELGNPEKIKFTPTVKVAEMSNGEWVLVDKEFVYFDDVGLKCPYEKE